MHGIAADPTAAARGAAARIRPQRRRTGTWTFTHPASSVARASIAAHTSGRANPRTTTKPRSRHDRRPELPLELALVLAWSHRYFVDRSRVMHNALCEAIGQGQRSG